MNVYEGLEEPNVKQEYFDGKCIWQVDYYMEFSFCFLQCNIMPFSVHCLCVNNFSCNSLFVHSDPFHEVKRKREKKEEV